MTNTFTMHTPEDGSGFKPVTVAALREHVVAADAEVEIEIQLPDGSVRKAFSIVTNQRTRDSFRLVLASSEPRERRGLIRSADPLDHRGDQPTTAKS